MTIHFIIYGGRHLIIYRGTYFFAGESCITNQGNLLFARESKGNPPKGPKMLKQNYSRLREEVGGVLSLPPVPARFFPITFYCTTFCTAILELGLVEAQTNVRQDAVGAYIWASIYYACVRFFMCIRDV